jgi:hypothetical protein
MDNYFTLLVPALQAIATVVILNKQKEFHDEIAEKRIELIDEAVTNWIGGMEGMISSGMVGEAFGTVPASAAYIPVDSRETIYAAINENLQNVPAAERHIAAVNRMNENNDIVRMTAFSPEFLHLVHKSSSSIRDLINGKLSIDEVVNVLTDDSEQAALQGRIGNTGRRTHRSLGITRLNLQRFGRRELEAQVKLASAVSPMDRQQTMQDMLGTPARRVALALTQAQLIQQSLQNANNAAAAGNPTKLGELQLSLQKFTNRLAQEAQRGNMVNQFVPNFAALLEPQIKSITEALLGEDEKKEEESIF